MEFYLKVLRCEYTGYASVSFFFIFYNFLDRYFFTLSTGAELLYEFKDPYQRYYMSLITWTKYNLWL